MVNHEYVFSCPSCGVYDVTFYGDRWNADGDCPACGTVQVIPDELLQSEYDERAFDATRDARFES